VKVIAGKEATFVQSMMASWTIGKKAIPKAEAIWSTSLVGPTIREVPESTIPCFNPLMVAFGTVMVYKLTGQ